MEKKIQPKKSKKSNQKRPVEHDDRMQTRATRRDESDDVLDNEDVLELLDSASEEEEGLSGRKQKNTEKNPAVKLDNEIKKATPKQGNEKRTEENSATLTETDTVLTNILILVSIVFVILAIAAAFVRSNNGFNLNRKIDIELSIKQLENDFQNQSLSSFKKLKSRMVAYMEHRTSPQPFVLLVASTQDNQPTADCFARRVTQLITNSQVTINGSKYSNITSDDAKSEIDEDLRDEFRKGKFPTAAIIHNFDEIPYGTTALFYAYCDHDNPMYEEAAIIFTITLPEDYDINSNEIEREALVAKYLSEDSQWVKDETFSSDVMGALISRITDTVIVVNQESRETLGESCSAK